jgi:hypothetical protein
MLEEPMIIAITPDSELAHLIEQAAGRPLVLEKDGVRYRLERDDEGTWAGYDPEAAREGMRAAAGSWSNRDAEQLKAALYRAREEGSRPANRP